MLTTGNATADALLQSGAKQIPTLTFTFSDSTTLTVGADKIMSNGISIIRSAFSGNTLEVGAVVAADLTITLFNKDGYFDGYVFDGAKCFVSVSVENGGTLYSVSLGHFIIDGSKTQNGILTLTGMDCMVQLEIPYEDGDIPSNMFPAPLPNVLLYLNSALINKGVSVVFVFDYNNIPEIMLGGIPKVDGMTYRSLLSWLLQLYGHCAYADTDSDAIIRDVKYIHSPMDGSLYLSHRIKSELSKESVAVDKVSMNGYEAGVDDPIYEVKISDNPLFDSIIETETLTKDIVINLIWSYMFTIYKPMTATVLPCPLYMPYDNFYYYTDSTNRTTTLLSDVNYKLNANIALEAKGISTVQNSYAQNSPVTQRQADYISAEVKKGVDGQGDYIVEIGTDANGWTYEKRNSGVLIADKIQAFGNLVFQQPTGFNVAYTDLSTYPPSATLANTQKIVTGDVYGSSSGAFISAWVGTCRCITAKSGSDPNGVEIRLLAATTSVSTTAQIQMHFVGRWR